MKWFMHSRANSNRCITILNECTGSPDCWVEIRLDDIRTREHVEIHLGESEARALREEIKRLLKDSRASR